MIFTTSYMPFKASPSTLFKEKGDLNGYPGTIPESKTIIYNKRTSTHRSLYLTTLAITMASTITNRILDEPRCIIGEPIVSPLFPEPQVEISFDRDNETAISAIKNRNLTMRRSRES